MDQSDSNSIQVFSLFYKFFTSLEFYMLYLEDIEELSTECTTLNRAKYT